jgi:hypothetical protein
MELNINVSDKMGAASEDDLIRFHPDMIKDSGLRAGSILSVKCKDGASLNLKVGLSDEKGVVVSRRTYKRIKEGPYKTTLGCDPEFLFIDPLKRICRADTFLPKYGKVGHDGPLGELRPDPGEHEDEVVENLRKLIHSLPDHINEKFGHRSILTPEAHSEMSNLSLGFHIHLGAPEEITSFVAPQTREFVESFTNAMDYFVGVPSIIPEDNSLRRLNKVDEYGRPGDWRTSKHTIEYRTPGGFHLRHPDYARGIMGIALCVGESVMSWAEEKSNSWSKLDKVSAPDIIANEFGVPDKSGIKRVFDERKKSGAVVMLPDIIDSLEKMSHYKKHEASIKTFLKMVLNSSQVNPQLLVNW